MSPLELFRDGGPEEFGLHALHASEPEWKPLVELGEQWADTTGLFLGQTQWGDPFWWLSGNSGIPDGSIFLLNHEGALGERPVVFFSRTFAEFLCKLAHFRCIDGAVKDPLFRQECAELNAVRDL